MRVGKLVQKVNANTIGVYPDFLPKNKEEDLEKQDTR